MKRLNKTNFIKFSMSDEIGSRRAIGYWTDNYFCSKQCDQKKVAKIYFIRKIKNLQKLP